MEETLADQCCSGPSGNTEPYARDVIVNRLVEEFGAWATSTGKVLRWEIVPRELHVVVLEADRGTIVIPWNSARDSKPYWGKINDARFENGRPVHAGRSTNIVSHAPSLGWDKDILYLSPMTHWELDRTVEFIQRKARGLAIEISQEPDPNSPILGIGAQIHDADGRGPVPFATVRAVFDRDGQRCAWCGGTERLHVDHIVPRAKGGSNEAGNLQVLCRDCNLKKSDRI